MERRGQNERIEAQRNRISAYIARGFLYGLLFGIALFLALRGTGIAPDRSKGAEVFLFCSVTFSCITGFIRMIRILKRIHEGRALP